MHGLCLVLHDHLGQNKIQSKVFYKLFHIYVMFYVVYGCKDIAVVTY
jgi:hypothetical protein